MTHHRLKLTERTADGLVFFGTFRVFKDAVRACRRNPRRRRVRDFARDFFINQRRVAGMSVQWVEPWDPAEPAGSIVTLMPDPPQAARSYRFVKLLMGADWKDEEP